MKVPDPYIRAAVESIAAIQSYAPEDEQVFYTDAMVQDAVLMRLQDLGENLNRVGTNFSDFWKAHAGTEWEQAIGLRNIISHDYGSVRMDLVWKVIVSDLSPLRKSLEGSLR